jgi:hypothetical protein
MRDLGLSTGIVLQDSVYALSPCTAVVSLQLQEKRIYYLVDVSV